MTRDESRRALEEYGSPLSIQRSDEEPASDFYRALGLRVDFDAHDKATLLEAAPGKATFLLGGADVFVLPMDALAEAIGARTPVDEDDSEYGYTYSFPVWGLALWRSTLPEDSDEGSGVFVESIALRQPTESCPQS